MIKSSNRLRHLSPFTYFLERLFAFFSLVSLADCFFGPREDFPNTTTSVQKVKVTIRRGRQIEGYILLWSLSEVVCSIAVPAWPLCRWPVRILLAYRVFEIMQAQLNLNLFSALRTHGRTPRVASLARTVVLSFWNFGELLLCFGIVYSSSLSSLENAETWFDAYYFSVTTQLTIGYGDISPLGPLKILAAAQGLCGFILAVIVLGRLVAFLPRTEPVLRSR